MRNAEMPSPGKSSYRPDIDGLRAVAVIPVILFHAGFSLFSGGYIGVDIFFVISGFLITGILTREIYAGHYSILEFYRRRARRIFPALAAMTLVTLLVGFFIVTPKELVALGKSAGAIAVFGSNFYFWKSVNYFDAGALFQPLLHTWSLAVEEQYYIVFPLLLWLFRKRRKWLLAILWGVAVLSFVLAVLLVAWKPATAFYLLPSRAWELMVGGLLAVGCFPRPGSERAAWIASVAGLVLIGVPIFLYTSATAFPGLAALPPVLGTALIIWAEGRGAGRILSKAPFVSVGLASYSLYLWHLPIIDFAKYMHDGPLPTAVAILLSLISLGVAYVSLRYIEGPFRHSQPKRKANRLALFAVAGMLFVAGAAIAVVLDKGAAWRFSPQTLAQIGVADDEARHYSRCLSSFETWIDPRQACQLGDASAQPSVLLWGDSHAMVTATAMVAAARRQKASFLFAADADCPTGINFSVDPSVTPAMTTQGHYRRCGEYNRGMLDLALRSPQIRTVVLSSRWTGWRVGEPANPAEKPVDIRLRDDGGMASSVGANRAKFERGFAQLVDALRAAGKRVVIVGPLPEPRYNVPHRLYVSRFGFVDKPAPIALTDYRRRHAVIIGYFNGLELGPNVSFIWPAAVLCTGMQCPTVKDGIPQFLDHNHLSVGAALDTSRLYDWIFEGGGSAP